MFDTMVATKIVGSVCGALLIFLVGNMAAESLYSTEAGGHGDDHAQAYVIDTGEGDAPAEEAVEEVSFADLLAAADASKGEKVFKKCTACHKIEDGVNATGPSLFGIVDRDVAAAADFGYSAPMAEMGGVWDAERLDTFIAKPKDLVPGTKMSFSGLKSPEKRADLIAYLATLGG